VSTRLTFNPITQNFDWVAQGATSSIQAPVGVLENVPCEAAAQVGHAVYLNDDTLFRAQANSLTTAQVVGIIQQKPSSTLANLRFIYTTSSIYMSLTPGAIYFLSATTPGEITTTAPTTSGALIIKVGNAVNDSQLNFNFQIIARRAG
jgi:hypothetical protein